MRALLAIGRAAFADALARRASMFSQMAIMIVNDCAWILFWALFFGKVKSFNGWDLDRLILLQAVLTTGGGIALGLLSNTRRLASMAVDGELDSILALPVNPLLHLLVKRVLPINLGDVVFGVGLFAIAGTPTPARAAMFIVVALLSCVVLTGFLVAIGSSAFFVGRSEAGELGFHTVLLLGSYPVDVFSGGARIAMFTVIPAAFISTVPARLVERWDAWTLGSLVLAAVVFAALGWWVFHTGLRRYTSGSVWTRA